ncbi:glycosyltransferase family 4 protein [Reyranella sp. CPCC 100927]|uniref:glycosyltransferase family 4 protein n=1 Tax=Reyranella sp. CPCC 100927 TaxID=2599616 RepID=UPI0011B54451|nr:glycosyltransferase family 4 protein [Reyranella sp. CPCC 100927]TWT05751.1 glycosyltransferase family 4 protein [Reyranella sp. CPCC 100927]
MPQRRLLIAHPGATSLLYPLVALLQRMAFDVSFETSFYARPGDAFDRIARALPRQLRSRAERELGRRRHPDIAPRGIVTHPLPELVHVLASRTTSPALVSSLLRWRNARFDRLVAARIRRERPHIFIGFDGSCEQSLRACQETGTVSLLFQAIGHLRSGLRILEEERRLHPEFATTPLGDTSEGWIERNTREALLADRVIVPSDYVRETLADNGRAPATIDLLPYPVDTERFTPATAPRPPAPLRALFVGQVGMRKGVKYILEAAKLLDRHDIQIVLVGGIVDGTEWLQPYHGRYRHIANVPHAEMPAIFRDADIFVFPSLHEGSAMAINEALASGLPVIVTPNAGAVARDGIEGFVVPIRDAAAVADRMARLADDPALRQRMARAARGRAQAHDATAYSRNLAALLDRLPLPSR